MENILYRALIRLPQEERRVYRNQYAESQTIICERRILTDQLRSGTILISNVYRLVMVVRHA